MTLDATQKNSTARRSALRFAGIGLLVLALLAASQVLPLGRWLDELQHWIEGFGLLGPFIFALIFIAAAMFSLPVFPFAALAGSVFGLATGSLVIWIGSLVAASLGFLVGRYLAYERISAFAAEHERFRQIEEVVSEHEWKVIALMRLSHGFPFGLSNYVCGALPLRFRPYISASAVAMLPGVLMSVSLGAAGEAGLTGLRDRLQQGPRAWIPLFIGAAAMIALVIYVVTLVKRKLKESVERSRAEKSS